jgi:hypothetical protein
MGFASIQSCTFDRASAPRGGAIAATGGAGPPSIDVRDTTFSGCAATAAAAPGDATAWAGGALYMFGTGAAAVTATVTRCNFTGNTASAPTGAGGAAAVGGGAAHSLTLTNCTLTGNRAAYGGGVFTATRAALAVSGCSFSRNGLPSGSAGSAVYSFCPAQASLSTSSFLGSLQAFGSVHVACDAAGSAGSVSLDRCTFDAAPLAGEVAADYGGAYHVTAAGPVAVTVTRSSFLNAPVLPGRPNNFMAVVADVGAGGWVAGAWERGGGGRAGCGRAARARG